LLLELCLPWAWATIQKRKDYKDALEHAKEAETLFVQFGNRREIATDLQRIQDKASNVKSITPKSGKK
jgi:pyruvate/2-oxoacid:ferredoxin oxidoreductase alpha subunit